MYVRIYPYVSCGLPHRTSVTDSPTQVDSSYVESAYFILWVRMKRKLSSRRRGWGALWECRQKLRGMTLAAFMCREVPGTAKRAEVYWLSRGRELDTYIDRESAVGVHDDVRQRITHRQSAVALFFRAWRPCLTQRRDDTSVPN